MSRVITDTDTYMGQSPSCPTFIATTAVSQELGTTLSSITVGGDVFTSNTFPEVPWYSDRGLRAMTGETVNRDYHLRMDLEFDSPLLLASLVLIETRAYDVGTGAFIAAFARDTLRIDDTLIIPRGDSTFNAQYSASPFFVVPGREYRVVARTNLGTVDLVGASVSITRNN